MDVESWTSDLLRLHTGEPELVEFIREKIRRDGPVTFAWFMEQALYHPAHGYYSSGRAAIGRHGDYFTNVSVGPVFGELLARQFREMWERLGHPVPFTIVEQGAHNGDFAADVLRATREQSPKFFGAIRYCIIEPFAIWRQRQSGTLREFAERVSWCESLQVLEPFCGIHFSNELLDSFPVHLVRLAAGARVWEERYVALDHGEFVFVAGEISSRRVRERAGLIAAIPPYETEICLAAEDWIGVMAEKLTRGYVVSIDYGYPRDVYYAAERSSGTLRCYRAHRLVPSPLSSVGEADITAHVEWTSIAERALKCGWQLIGFTDQHHFLTGIVSNFSGDEFGDAKSRRAFQTLLQPEMLGRTFQFLVFGRGVPAAAKLSGLKFARDAKHEVGLDKRPARFS